MKTVLIVSRLFVGILFIFSGLIKANDAIGFSYKLEEYFTVFEDTFTFFAFTKLNFLSLFLSIFICVLEILLGAAVLIGFRAKSTSWTLLLLIIFFTILTGFSAITGKVTDCGCFGEAISLTPTQSFMKDIILLVFILLLFIKRNSIQACLNNRLAKILTIGAAALTLIFSLWCYYHLPYMDFRPYKAGNNITELMNDGVLPVIEPTFTYKHKQTGEIKEFVNSTPEDWKNWDYQDRNDKIIKEGQLPTIHDFIITDDDGDEVTDLIIDNPDHNFLLITYDVSQANKPAFKKINALADIASQNNIQFFGLTASPYESLDPFRHEMQSAFPFFYADATTLKTIIRSNSGLLLLKNGTILAKWHYNDIPSFEKVQALYF